MFFFGPLDLSYVSRTFVSYSAFDIIKPVAIVFGIVFIFLLLLASIPGGKIHSFLISLYTGFSICLYVQGAFLNPDFGTLDGHSVNWPGYSKQMLINLLLWAVIILIPFMIHYYSVKKWKTAVVLISSVLIIMQAISLGTKLVDQKKIDAEKTGNYYLSNENMLKLGKKNNVVVFLLDTVSNKVISETVKSYPDILKPFKDFTSFDNANTTHLVTVPSVVDILTAYDPVIETYNFSEHVKDAWQNPKAEAFYSSLQNKGFEINLFVLAKEITRNLGDIQKYVSNLKNQSYDFEIDKAALKKLFMLSCYRYLPISLKPFFVIYTADIANITTAQNAIKDQWDFVYKFNEKDLEFGDRDKIFNFYYLQGCHSPLIMDEKGMIHVDSKTSSTQQTAGFLNMIAQYMDQMKNLGVYDDATIIILADHGNNWNWNYDPLPFFWIKQPNQSFDEIQINHAPITTQIHTLPTIAQILDLSDYDFGETVFDVDQNAVIDRYARYVGIDDSYPKAKSSKGFNIMLEYHYSGNTKDLMEAVKNDEKKVIPMTESYY